MSDQTMYTTSERICLVHVLLQNFPHVLDHTSVLEEMLCRRHQTFHVVSYRNVQPLLSELLVPIPLGLQEIPNTHKTLQDIKRVLKPGGVLAVTEFITDPDYPLKSTTIKTVEKAGFLLDRV
jgi:predicted methyltransferase